MGIELSKTNRRPPADSHFGHAKMEENKTNKNFPITLLAQMCRTSCVEVLRCEGVLAPNT